VVETQVVETTEYNPPIGLIAGESAATTQSMPQLCLQLQNERQSFNMAL
jgi:hypothetical protein